MTAALKTLLQVCGLKPPALVMMAGHTQSNPAGPIFYSQLPILWGPFVAKVAVAPVSQNLTSLSEKIVNLEGKPDGLRDELTAVFTGDCMEWGFRAQLLTDLKSMPIEDASVVWSEAESPYVTVATIRINAQCSYSDYKEHLLGDKIAFNPWNGIMQHRPLGSVMRARKTAYAASAAYRAEKNGCPIFDPKSVTDILTSETRPDEA